MENKPVRDGGPAFPSGKSETPGYENSHPCYEGMTLRDYFAAKAMQGMFAGGMIEAANQQGLAPVENERACAFAAYAMADAMLAAREQQPEATYPEHKEAQ